MVAEFLLNPITICIPWIAFAIFPPVMGITFPPFALRLPLISPIGIIVLYLLTLPFCLTCSLTLRFWTVFLIGILGPGVERIVTIFTVTTPDHMLLLKSVEI
jgi:hypothetical protein